MKFLDLQFFEKNKIVKGQTLQTFLFIKKQKVTTNELLLINELIWIDLNKSEFCTQSLTLILGFFRSLKVQEKAHQWGGYLVCKL